MESSVLTWMVIFPFLGAAILGAGALLRWEKAERYAGAIASGMIFISFFKILPSALEFISNPATEQLRSTLGSWINIAGVDFQAKLKVDALSALLCLIVTGVGLLIHIYSIGYMAHEAGRARYFAYLNLFCGFMLLLVTASSLPLLFVGWEGVGLCSYLLIGFWFTDQEKAAAGRKAFVVNRIGDAGMLLGIFLAFTVFKTFEFDAIAKAVPLIAKADPGVLELMAFLFFIGCVGKSAQFPLYIWLPDAMAGPTPVSALIHAATMVTSGVYLLARMSTLYAFAPVVGHVVAVVGCLTAFLAATMAVAQTDIKKVLAFSTVSQLGFMVLGAGVGTPWTGMWHLITHAFFKALLFLGAGSVIHAMHGEQNILKMGGLKNYIVATTVTFFAGVIAIIGVPFTSGWYSKDAVLYSTWESGQLGLFFTALAAALLTTVYMTRLFCLTFLGVPKSPKHQLSEIRESPPSMVWPMVVLAFFAIFSGMMPFDTSLKAHFGIQQEGPGHLWLTESQFSFALGVLVMAMAFLTYKTYAIRPAWLSKLQSHPAKEWMARQYRIDEIFVGTSRALTNSVSTVFRLFDEQVVDRGVNGLARRFTGASTAFANLQSGVVQAYVLTLLVGFVAVGWYLVSRFQS